MTESPDVLDGRWVKETAAGLRRYVGPDEDAPDRVHSPGAVRMDGLHYCVKCGDNVAVLSPERLCTYCKKGKTMPIPDYCLKVAQLLAVTENHPDPVVRSVRKILTQAAVALDAAHTSSKVSPISPPALQRPTKLTTRQRLDRLGVTGTEVRAWASEHGFDNVPARGILSGTYLDAYEKAHS